MSQLAGSSPGIRSNPATSLADLLRTTDRPLLFAGVYDALSARVAEISGMDGVWVSGYSVSAGRYALPDVGMTTFADMADLARQITSAVSIPVVVDGESGYGNALNVMRSVEEFEAAGSAGMQLGDEEVETCPYLGMPTRILPEEDGLLKIGAALAARKSADFLIFATSADKRARLPLYAKAGAQCVLFPWEEIVQDKPDEEWQRNLSRFVDAGTVPVAVLTPFLPSISAEELWELGFKLVVFAVEAIYASAKIQSDLWREVRDTGTTKDFGHMYRRQGDFLRLVGEERIRALAERFVPGADRAKNDRTRFARR